MNEDKGGFECRKNKKALASWRCYNERKHIYKIHRKIGVVKINSC